MEYGIQEILKMLGDEGCYFLCLLNACGIPNGKIVNAYCECLERKLIEKDCYVNDPVAVLRLFGMDVTRVLKEYSGQKIVGDPKLIVACYEWGRSNHFVMVNKSGLWDPMGESNIVKNGTVHSYRIFY